MRTSAVLLLTVTLVALTPTLAQAATPEQAHGRPSASQVEGKLSKLGLPVGHVNSSLDAYSYRGICAWRELTGRGSSKAKITDSERQAVLNTASLTLPSSMVVGINVNRTCQTANWVVRDKSGNKVLKAVFGISSGMSGHTTPSGFYRVNRQINGWHESSKYAGAMMYRPKYFNGGIAMHGSYTDSLVYPYPASHGCVRMLHKDIDRLWSAGVGPGTTVRVY